MTAQEVWESLPEFQILTQIAEDLRIEIRLRGSLAERLLRVVPPQERVPVSMLDFVPPFGDIELSVPPHAIGHVSALIGAHIPQARFFRWNIDSPTRLRQRDASSYVAVVHRPEIGFGPAKGSDVHLQCVYIKNEFNAEPNKPLMPQKPDLFWNELRRGTSSTLAFVDLLSLATSYPELLDHPLVRNLRDQVSEGASAISTLVPGMGSYETLVVSILRFLYREQLPSSAPPRWFMALCGALAAMANDPRLKDLLRQCDHAQVSEPLAAVVRGNSEHGVWRRSIHSLQFLRSETAWRRESAALIKRLAADASPPFRRSPAFAVAFEEGPEDDCCRYEDFARGVVEIAWHDPEGPAWPVSSAFVFVDVSEEADSDSPVSEDNLGIAHAHATFARTGTVRSDYNFLSILAGRSRELKIIATSGD